MSPVLWILSLGFPILCSPASLWPVQDPVEVRSAAKACQGSGETTPRFYAAAAESLVPPTAVIPSPPPPVRDSAGTEGRSVKTMTVQLAGGASMEFVWIEPGTFSMGSPAAEPDRDLNEGPWHQVTISRGFWLGKFEITQAQWESVMGNRPWAGMEYVQENPNHPAVYVSWGDVQGFIQRLNRAAGDSLYRLPTEAEWEYACRAGTQTRWSYGDEKNRLGNYAWYGANAWGFGVKYARAVGQKEPNPWGLCDMHGNVWEWCQDWYSANFYMRRIQADPAGPISGSHRVDRGGSFDTYARNTRSAVRGGDVPDGRYCSLGARLLRIK
jgi:formylglycine-generating enzyme required for sulfatase activity